VLESSQRASGSTIKQRPRPFASWVLAHLPGWARSPSHSGICSRPQGARARQYRDSPQARHRLPARRQSPDEARQQAERLLQKAPTKPRRRSSCWARFRPNTPAETDAAIRQPGDPSGPHLSKEARFHLTPCRPSTGAKEGRGKRPERRTFRRRRPSRRTRREGAPDPGKLL